MSDSSRPVTHIVVGTKAQFIKMAPIARVLEDRGWPYRLLDLGQHGSITKGILEDFALTPDHVHVMPAGKTVATYGQAAGWVATAVRRIFSSREALKSSLLRSPPGCALIHGDTLSTLLGLYLAKRLDIKVGLVEAGLTSGTLLDPFPEEMIRRHVERRVDFLFAPDQVSAQRLSQRRLKGQIVNTQYNTGRDALALIARSHVDRGRGTGEPRTVLTLHRAETISRPVRLRKIIHHVCRLAPSIAPIRFYLHEPTIRALKKARILDELRRNPSFVLSSLGTYPEFMRALAECDYVLTDGGSVQEEASYLGKPCLILRQATERSHGLGLSAALMTFDVDKDLRVLFRPGKEGPLAEAWRTRLTASSAVLDAIYRG